MRVLTAPARDPDDLGSYEFSVFLAGSIEQGQAEEWQQALIARLRGTDYPVLLYNPRRPHWDASLRQTIDEPKFVEQVRWELDHLEDANVAFFYFDPASKSPVTLAELGYVLGTYSASMNMLPPIVVCPPAFWRRGNVEIMCRRLNIPVYDSLDQGIRRLLKLFEDET